MRKHHILNNLKRIVNTALNVARPVYYRNQEENVRGVEYFCFQLYVRYIKDLHQPYWLCAEKSLRHIHFKKTLKRHWQSMISKEVYMKWLFLPYIFLTSAMEVFWRPVKNERCIFRMECVSAKIKCKSKCLGPIPMIFSGH